MSSATGSLKEQVYKDERPAEFFDQYYDRAMLKNPTPMYELVRVLLAPFGWLVFGASCRDRHNVPHGSVIFAPNHFSNMDHFFVAMFLLRHVRFMAKSQLFRGPIAFILTHGGVFPVRRGHRDERWYTVGKWLLDIGKSVILYLEGGRSRSGKISDIAKPGIGRFALATGRPVVPVAIHGSEGARNWRRLRFPLVTVKYGRPMVWKQVDSPTAEQQQAVADEILVEIKRLYAELAAEQEHAKISRAIRRMRWALPIVVLAMAIHLMV